MPEDVATHPILSQINRDELVELGKDLIRIPSKIGEETPVARWTAEYMKSRGLEVELQEVEPGWFQAIGVIKGSGGGRSIMLNGHLDSNPIAAGWTRNPYDPWVEGNRLFGAGIRNMKSGVASMIHAADAIIKSGVKLRGDVVVACVLAELQGGLGTLHAIENGYKTDVAVVTEPYGAHQVCTKHGGMTKFSLHVKGRHPHGADVHGVDAIPKMIKAIEAIYATRLTHDPWVIEGLPWLKIGSIIGGRGESYDMRSVSRNCDLCTAFIAVSTVPGMTADTLRADLEATLNRLKSEDPDFEYDLVHPIERKFNTWILDHPPMDMAEDEEIVKVVSESYRRVTGNEVRQVGPPESALSARYGDDDAHLWLAGIPAPIYGPSGGSYGVDYSDIDEMELCSRVLALTAESICS